MVAPTHLGTSGGRRGPGAAGPPSPQNPPSSEEGKNARQRYNCHVFPKMHRTMPKLVLPSANESVMLKIIYSIFNSDYTRQGDLNLITKLEGFKTNPFKSDTVD